MKYTDQVYYQHSIVSIPASFKGKHRTSKRRKAQNQFNTHKKIGMHFGDKIYNNNFHGFRDSNMLLQIRSFLWSWQVLHILFSKWDFPTRARNFCTLNSLFLLIYIFFFYMLVLKVRIWVSYLKKWTRVSFGKDRGVLVNTVLYWGFIECLWRWKVFFFRAGS